MFIPVITSTASAQPTIDPTPVQSTELRVTSIEQNYDRQVIEILSNYFDRKKFYVDVHVNAKIADETYLTQQDKTKKEKSRNVLMPGLPYLPAENMQNNEPHLSSETIVNKNKFKTLRVVNLKVNIYVDSSVGDVQVDFMRTVAAVAAKTSKNRGDVINISRVSIPDLSSQDPTVAVRPEDESTNLSGLFNLLNPYFLGIILLIVVGFVFGVKQFNQDPQPKINRRGRRNRLKNDGRRDKNQDSTITQSNITAGNDQTYTALNKLIDNFYRKPKETALLLESWIVENKENGLEQAARVVKAVDGNILKLLTDNLQSSDYSAIIQTIKKLPKYSLKENRKIAKEFNALLEVNANGATSMRKHGGPLALFHFLAYTSDESIYQLISNEDVKSVALVLDHLSDKRAASLLNMLDEGKATEIMIAMTQLETLSYKERKAISESLFDKTVQLKNAEKQTGIDFEHLVTILDELPLHEQQKYINELKSSGTPLGTFIETHFVTLDQIPSLDDQIIKTATSSIDTETLLDSVIGLDKATTEKILSVRPQREQRLMEMELDQMDNKNELDTEYAKLELITAIRKTVRRYRKA